MLRYSTTSLIVISSWPGPRETSLRPCTWCGAPQWWALDNRTGAYSNGRKAFFDALGGQDRRWALDQARRQWMRPGGSWCLPGVWENTVRSSGGREARAITRWCWANSGRSSGGQEARATTCWCRVAWEGSSARSSTGTATKGPSTLALGQGAAMEASSAPSKGEEDVKAWGSSVRSSDEDDLLGLLMPSVLWLAAGDERGLRSSSSSSSSRSWRHAAQSLETRLSLE